jgi:hypothetical protein
LSTRDERRTARDAAIAAALQSAPPEGITREDLAGRAGCRPWEVVEPAGLLLHQGAATEPSPGRYAPAPGAGIAAALAAAYAKLEQAERQALERRRVAIAGSALARRLDVLDGEPAGTTGCYLDDPELAARLDAVTRKISESHGDGGQKP